MEFESSNTEELSDSRSTWNSLTRWPFMVVMINTSQWRSMAKTKLCTAILLTFLLLHLFFGVSLYHVDYNVFHYYGDSFSLQPTVDPRLHLPNITLVGNVISEPVENNDFIIMANSTEKWRMVSQNGHLKLCPLLPPSMVGPIRVWLDYPSYRQLQQLYPFLEAGGHSKPDNCLSRHRVAIIVPYRNRDDQLRVFLHNLHSLLTKQQLDYAIFVVEQINDQVFNRAKLMNVGFLEASKVYDWQCFIFHDVDLLPEDDRNLYSCPEQPRHMSVAVDKFKYRLPYGSIFGGISALTRRQFEQVNGFSNDYWGWGGEDDDLSTRMFLAGYKILRYPASIARYKMIKHDVEKENQVNMCRYKLMDYTRRRWKIDGLSNIQYNLLKVNVTSLFTLIRVDLLEDESKLRLRSTNICY